MEWRSRAGQGTVGDHRHMHTRMLMRLCRCSAILARSLERKTHHGDGVGGTNAPSLL